MYSDFNTKIILFQLLCCKYCSIFFSLILAVPLSSMLDILIDLTIFYEVARYALFNSAPFTRQHLKPSAPVV